MYDKVQLWLDRSVIGGVYPTIPHWLTRVKEQTDYQTGETNFFGCLEGLKVSMYSTGISIIGSLSKYLYKDNIYPLDRHSTKEAVEKLSDTLHTDIGKAKVTGLEFGTILLLGKPVEAYLLRLGGMPKMQRLQVEQSSLYYKSKSKKPSITLAFYDKAKQEHQDGGTLPAGLEGQNILKYELRLNRRLPTLLNCGEVKASTLSEKGFYKLVLERWESYYFSISKKKQLIIDSMSEIKTVTDAKNVFFAQLMAKSTKDDVGDFIEELRAAHVFSDRKNYTRLKKQLEKISDKAGIAKDDELIKELDNAIKNVGAYV